MIANRPTRPCRLPHPKLPLLSACMSSVAGCLVAATLALAAEPLGDPQTLPWNSAEGAEQFEALTGPRRMLDQSGIDASHLYRFRDFKPWSVDEDETLLKILYRLPRFSPAQLERWRQELLPWNEVLEDPEKFRVAVVRVDGRAKSIETVTVPPRPAERLGFTSYYRVRLTMDGSPHQAVVYSRAIPGAWESLRQAGTNIDQRASFLGMLLKVGDQVDGIQQFVFASSRIAWHPDQAIPQLNVGPSQILLGQLGMDLGLFDDVVDRRSLVPQDRECFYQMLAAASRADPEDLVKRTRGKYGLAPLITEYDSHRGNLVALTVGARRAVKIPIIEDDLRERFGLTHYYEINGFVDERVRVKRDQNDVEGTVYNRYPIVFCVVELPDGMPVGDDINETIRVPAFSFKMYAYKTDFTSEGGQRRRQLSPLLIGRRPTWIQYQRTFNPYLGLIAGGLFVAALAGVSFGLWRYSQGDEEFRRSTLARQYAPDDNNSLDELTGDAGDVPDFSYLERSGDD